MYFKSFTLVQLRTILASSPEVFGILWFVYTLYIAVQSAFAHISLRAHLLLLGVIFIYLYYSTKVCLLLYI